jgi:FtsH-binding integral membrane protein
MQDGGVGESHQQKENAMIESLARDYFASEDGRLLFYSLMILVGGAISMVSDRQTFQLRRLPFLGYSILILVIFTGLEAISRSFLPNVTMGPAWPLMLFEQASCGILGYALGIVGLARCRDGFGKNRKGLVMAAIIGLLLLKIAFFALMLKGSDTKDRVDVFA